MKVEEFYAVHGERSKYITIIALLLTRGNKK